VVGQMTKNASWGKKNVRRKGKNSVPGSPIEKQKGEKRTERRISKDPNTITNALGLRLTRRKS